MEEKDQIIANNLALRQKDGTIAVRLQQLRQKILQLEREKNQEKERLERQLGRVNQQLEESERVIAQFQRQITELEQLRAPTESDTACRNKEQNKSRFGIKLIWKEGEKAPCKMRYNCCAAMDGSTLYIRSLHLILYIGSVSAPPAGLNFQTAQQMSLPLSSSTISSPLLAVIRVLIFLGMT